MESKPGCLKKKLGFVFFYCRLFEHLCQNFIYVYFLDFKNFWLLSLWRGIFIILIFKKSKVEVYPHIFLSQYVIKNRQCLRGSEDPKRASIFADPSEHIFLCIFILDLITSAAISHQKYRRGCCLLRYLTIHPILSLSCRRRHDGKNHRHQRN